MAVKGTALLFISFSMTNLVALCIRLDEWRHVNLRPVADLRIIQLEYKLGENRHNNHGLVV